MSLRQWRYVIPLRMRSIFRRRQVERELDEELQLHLDMTIEANIARGMHPEEARRSALIAFGGMDQRKEECRDARGIRWASEFLQDIRYGWRMLRKSPGLALDRRIWRCSRHHRTKYLIQSQTIYCRRRDAEGIRCRDLEILHARKQRWKPSDVAVSDSPGFRLREWRSRSADYWSTSEERNSGAVECPIAAPFQPLCGGLLRGCG